MCKKCRSIRQNNQNKKARAAKKLLTQILDFCEPAGAASAFCGDFHGVVFLPSHEKF